MTEKKIVKVERKSEGSIGRKKRRREKMCQ